MSRRIQVVLDDRERDAFKARAAAGKQSLSEWLREVGRERLERERPARLASVDDLNRFFEACDEREPGQEPEWAEHLAVLSSSRGNALELT